MTGICTPKPEARIEGRYSAMEEIIALNVILELLLDIIFFYSDLMSGVSSNNCLVADSINSHHDSTTSKRELRLDIFT
ncbi:hypothetical protein VN97_g3271 [Penicillium thymicola]|uniref:Uncharacterized protein n=1 Tax=Penicillium thymicola TaxID=293382 RepID=A0AAI9XBF1_PENTH|nr:hypothetical protein VN97_g3271 [Penicillium thymicola]